MRTAWVRRETSVDVLDDREGLRRYTQAEVPCPGQGFYTWVWSYVQLAPVGVGDVRVLWDL